MQNNPGGKKADLHIHSNCSDGIYSPEEILDRAVKGGLSIIAIADHDSFAGAERSLVAHRQQPRPLRVLAGLEISSIFDDKEIHILGYFPKQAISPGLAEFLAQVQSERVERIRKGLQKLAAIGVKLDFSTLQQGTAGNSVGRGHLAKAMIEKGYAESMSDAFKMYLGYDVGIIPMMRSPAEKVIRLIKESDGLAIWAHPPIHLFDGLLEKLTPLGLDGIEVNNRRRSGLHSLYYEKVAEDFRLLATGGSDWHGYDGDMELGEFYVRPDEIKSFLEKFPE